MGNKKNRNKEKPVIAITSTCEKCLLPYDVLPAYKGASWAPATDTYYLKEKCPYCGTVNFISGEEVGKRLENGTDWTKDDTKKLLLMLKKDWDDEEKAGAPREMSVAKTVKPEVILLDDVKDAAEILAAAGESDAQKIVEYNKKRQ
jgi:hypothetical protein